MTVKDLILIALSSLVLTACGGKTLYSDYQPVDLTGWNMDSVVTFTVPVTDTVNAYDVILHVRHTDSYPYQNMWLFVRDGVAKTIGADPTTDSAVAKADTIEFYLADDRGQWLGNGHALIDMPVLYRENVVFQDSIYTIQIQQGMREVLLSGISDIGVEIVR